MRLILAFLCATVASWAQYPVNGGLGGGGGGFTAPSGYSATVTGLTTLTVTAAQHGQGPAPTAWCFDNAAPALATSCSYTVSSIGDVVFTWSPAFMGYILIRGPGASAGAAGDVVGPAGATAGALACYSGTSGKIIAGCTPLSTPGAVPYVVSAGVLGQDQTAGGQFFWDATNHRLGIGTGTPTHGATISGTSNTVASEIRIIAAAVASGYLGANSNGLNLGTDTAGIIFKTGVTGGGSVGSTGTERARIASTGNFLIGPSPTDGNYKLDVQASGTTGTLRAFNQAVGGSTLVVVQAGDTQSGNLLSVRNNAGTELAYITSAGNIFTSKAIQIGAAEYFKWENRSLFRAPADGVLTFSNSAEADFNRLQFGGTTSSFPALKRSGAGLQVRLADDSAFTTIQASNYISNDGSTGITGATCSSFKNGICVAP